MPKPVPPEVVEAGRALIVARKAAYALSEAIDAACAALGPAVDVMTKDHGAKHMEAGQAYANLRIAQSAYGLVMEAHESLRQVLGKHDVESPTDDQVASIR